MPSAEPSHDLIPWNRLLRAIHSREVIPIIGPDLVTLEQGGQQVPFTDWLVPHSARELGLDCTPT